MKRQNFLIITLLSSIVLMSSCRVDWNQNLPQPGQPAQLQVFDEEFNSDRNGWSFADEANLAYGVVSDGTFKFDYNDNLSDAYYAAKFFGFNPYNDFSITARIGSDNNMGILFGYDDQKGAYGYSFMIDYNGYYALYDEGGNGYGEGLTVLIGPETNNFVRGNGDWNQVKIVQQGDNWIGYINDHQVFYIQAQNMRGSGVGFIDGAQTHGEADFITAQWYN